MINRKELTNYLNEFFNVKNFEDYGPNGLQIEGKQDIRKIAFAVSATKNSIDQAVAMNADALIVHHGLFWKFHGAKTLTGAFYHRVAPLIKNDLNLYGYHLPLDGHLEIGNAASLAKKLELKKWQNFGNHKGMSTGVMGEFQTPVSPDELCITLQKILNHTVLHSCPNKKQIKSIGIITGGANSNWIDCLEHNLDAYLTGEMSEHDWHEAKESGIHFFAGGHNATEQFGIQNLLIHLQKQYKSKDLEYVFIPSDNPA